MSRRRTTAAAAMLCAVLLLVGCGSTYTPPPGPSPTRAPSVGEVPESNCSDSLQSYAPNWPGAAQLPTGELTVAVNTDAPPLAWQSQTGEFQGFEVDLAHAIADHLYRGPGHLRLVPADDDLLNLLPNDREDAHPVDLAIGQVPLTCGNWDRATLSASYLTTSTALVGRVGAPIPQSLDSLTTMPQPHDRVCTNEGTGQPQLTGARAASSMSECLMWLQQGDVDLIVTEAAQAHGLLEQDPTLRSVADDDAINYGVAAGQSWSGLQAGVNQALSQWIASGGWQQSYDRWLREDLGDARPPQPSYGRTP